MTLIESIVRELPNLPARKLVEVARLIHNSSDSARAERARILQDTHGYLDDQDGQAFEAGYDFKSAEGATHNSLRV